MTQSENAFMLQFDPPEKGMQLRISVLVNNHPPPRLLQWQRYGVNLSTIDRKDCVLIQVQQENNFLYFFPCHLGPLYNKGEIFSISKNLSYMYFVCFFMDIQNYLPIDHGINKVNKINSITKCH